MARGGKKKTKKKTEPGPWPRLMAAGFVAVAALATAAGVGGNGAAVTSDGPPGCVLLKVAP
jgi:hypothetical protein